MAVCVASFLLAMTRVVLFSQLPAERQSTATLTGSNVP